MTNSTRLAMKDGKKLLNETTKLLVDDELNKSRQEYSTQIYKDTFIAQQFIA